MDRRHAAWATAAVSGQQELLEARVPRVTTERPPPSMCAGTEIEITKETVALMTQSRPNLARKEFSAAGERQNDDIRASTVLLLIPQDSLNATV